MEFEETLLVAGSLVLKYETGDIILLSEIQDSLAGLKDYFLDDPVALSVIEVTVALTWEELRGNSPADYLPAVTQGLDLLATFPGSDAITLTERRATARAWVAAHAPAPPQAPENACADNAMLDVFIAEARARFSESQSLLLELETDPANKEIVQKLFRHFHTVKGEAGFLKIASLGELAHNAESLLDLIRNGKAHPDRAVIDILLQAVDLAQTMLSKLVDGDFHLVHDVPIATFLSGLAAVTSAVRPSLGDLLVREGKLGEPQVADILQKQWQSGFSKKFGEIAVADNHVTAADLLSTLEKQDTAPATARKVSQQERVVKVQASQVTFLVDMIGELLISLSQVPEETPHLAQIRKITRSLQYGAMEMRTDSARALFGNVRRVVRDLSLQLGKRVKLEVTGEDLQIDRNLIDKLEEPIVHLVRNSLDHGLESEQERVAAGKAPEGTVFLTAQRRGNHVVLTIADDGKGLDRKRIVSKALALGLVTADRAQAMSDSEAYSLIFASGLSTQDKVSLISGRGVGMDIVRAVVTENRGRIETESRPGLGSSFSLVFPLSTAIIDGMVVRVEQTMFILPIASVVESVKVAPASVRTVTGKVRVIDLRGEVLSFLSLREVFGLPPKSEAGALIGTVVETSDKRKFIFEVDEVVAKREVVIKSLGPQFQDMRGITSGTVLNGGQIGLVVDVDQIVEESLLETSP